ncbi:MAG: S-layer homology domain-containing protein [Oscillospiraceae bacterium]|nr:S-layer homology domain-containing protein [Oscillospiraceae bacterium]
MRLWKKTLSVGLSLVMCASMVAPGFAASFAELQGAINTGKSVYQEDGTTYKIEASTDDTGAVNVKLYEKVKYEENEDPKTITILEGKNVTIDLNGNDIDGQGKSGTSVITINKGGELTLTDSTAKWVEDEAGDKTLASGAITGGRFTAGFQNGGGVNNSGTLNMENCAIRDNTARQSGGGVYNTGTVNMENCVIEGNTASNAYGGGVYNEGTLNMENCVIEGNTANIGGGVYNMGNALKGGTVNMENCVIEGNKAITGGGVYNNRSTFNMESSVVKDNTGGGVYNTGAFNMNDSVIEGNTASSGGGVYNWDTGVLKIEDSVIKDNTATGTGGGGGVLNRAEINMKNSVIEGNKTTGSKENGGGVNNWGTFNMESGVIKDNTATGSGGGVFNKSSSSVLKIEDGVIEGNTATSGGGVYVNGTLNMMNGDIEGNTAAKDGGGVYVKSGTFNMANGDIKGNTAGQGADIYCKKPVDMLDLPDDSLWDNEKGDNVYSGEKLETVKTATYLKHHEHSFKTEEVTKQPTCTEEGTMVGYGCSCEPIVEKTIPVVDHTPGDPVEENRVEPQVGEAGSYDEVFYCAVCGEELSRKAKTLDALSATDPVTTTPTTEIDDVEVPLAAGPVTRAEFIDYLWRHEGKPANNRVCTFADVSADHEYILALAWAERNGIAEADEDGNFQPDELVTVGAVREFLGNFARVFGMDVDVYALTTLTGEDDEAALNCDEILAEFFGGELAEQAA